MPTGGGQTIGEHAAGAAGADDDVIKACRRHHCPRLTAETRAPNWTMYPVLANERECAAEGEIFTPRNYCRSRAPSAHFLRRISRSPPSSARVGSSCGHAKSYSALLIIGDCEQPAVGATGRDLSPHCVKRFMPRADAKKPKSLPA